MPAVRASVMPQIATIAPEIVPVVPNITAIASRVTMIPVSNIAPQIAPVASQVAAVAVDVSPVMPPVHAVVTRLMPEIAPFAFSQRERRPQHRKTHQSKYSFSHIASVAFLSASRDSNPTVSSKFLANRRIALQAFTRC